MILIKEKAKKDLLKTSGFKRSFFIDIKKNKINIRIFIFSKFYVILFILFGRGGLS